MPPQGRTCLAPRVGLVGSCSKTTGEGLANFDFGYACKNRTGYSVDKKTKRNNLSPLLMHGC